MIVCHISPFKARSHGTLLENMSLATEASLDVLYSCAREQSTKLDSCALWATRSGAQLGVILSLEQIYKPSSPLPGAFSSSWMTKS